MAALVVDALVAGLGSRYVPDQFWPGYAEEGYCGVSFNTGLLRFHDAETGPLYREYLLQAFPELPKHADVLAFDWQGRQIVTHGNSGRLQIADPATGTVTDFCTVDEFSTALKIDGGHIALDGEVLNEWRQSVGRPGAQVPWGAAVSYEVPLFAGGGSSVETLELTDLDVLWNFTVQVLAQVRGIPPGTPIRISI